MCEGAEAGCTLKGTWEEDHVRLEANRMGHVRVSGELFEHGDRDQHLKFEFRTDQTVLPSLRDALRALLDA
jgi:hypothetical protein